MATTICATTICVSPDPNVCRLCEFKTICFLDEENGTIRFANERKNACSKCGTEKVVRQLFTSTYLGCPICEK